MEKTCLNCEYFRTAVTDDPCKYCRDNNKFVPKKPSLKELQRGYMADLYQRADFEYPTRLFVEQSKIKNMRLEIKNMNIDLKHSIKNVIFNEPATIVFWTDGTKTVVKCYDENFDPEKGIAMAITKKVLGNKYDYYNTIKHWLKKYEPKTKNEYTTINIGMTTEKATEAMEKLKKTAEKCFRGRNDE